MKRTLALKKEALIELSPDDLSTIVGGTAASLCACETLSCNPCQTANVCPTLWNSCAC